MTDHDLKPCPFCGGEAEHDSLHYTGGTSVLTIDCGHAVYCLDMDCIGCPSFSRIYDTEEEAITAWNTRAKIETPKEQ